MAISMESLLGELASELGELIPGVAINSNAVSGQVTTANNPGTSLVDINNRFEYDENILARSYLRVVSDTSLNANVNKVVRIATYNVSTSTMTLTPGLSSINTSTQYQIFRRLPPSAYLQAAEESLRLAYPSVYSSKANTTLNVSPNIYIYTVPGDIEDVSRVEIQNNIGIASYPYTEIPFETRRVSNHQELQLMREYSSNYRLRISGAGYITAPTTLLGTVDVSGDEIEIVKMGMKSGLYRRLAGTSSDGSDDQNNYFNMADRYYQLFLEAKAKHHKSLPRQTIVRDPRYSWL